MHTDGAVVARYQSSVPTSFWISLLAPDKSYGLPTSSKATFKNIGK